MSWRPLILLLLLWCLASCAGHSEGPQSGSSSSGDSGSCEGAAIEVTRPTDLERPIDPGTSIELTGWRFYSPIRCDADRRDPVDVYLTLVDESGDAVASLGTVTAEYVSTDEPTFVTEVSLPEDLEPGAYEVFSRYLPAGNDGTEITNPTQPFQISPSNGG